MAYTSFFHKSADIPAAVGACEHARFVVVRLASVQGDIVELDVHQQCSAMKLSAQYFVFVFFLISISYNFFLYPVMSLSHFIFPFLLEPFEFDLWRIAFLTIVG